MNWGLERVPHPSGICRDSVTTRAGRLACSWISGAVLFVAIMAGAPAPAGTFITPKGCTARLTVQQADCQVAHHYTCEGDAEGDVWSVYLSADGPYYLSRIDRETRWIENFDLIAGDAERLGEEKKAASFTRLLETGRDDFDFTTVSSNGDVRRYVGYDELTGEKTTIDGVTLERTAFDLQTFDGDGKVVDTRRGGQFIDRESRQFFGGEEDFTDAAGQTVHVRSTPITFAKPGERGFLTDTPEFGCDEMMTRNDSGAPDLVPAAYGK